MEKIIPFPLKDSQIRSSLYVNRDLDRRATYLHFLGTGLCLLTRDLMPGKDIVSGRTEKREKKIALSTNKD